MFLIIIFVYYNECFGDHEALASRRELKVGTLCFMGNDFRSLSLSTTLSVHGENSVCVCVGLCVGRPGREEGT